MARKVYTISNINGGISNDKNFCEPGQVADCSNIDIIADSNSIRLAGESSPSPINERGKQGKIIGGMKFYYLSQDGKYDTDSFYGERTLKRGVHPSYLDYALFCLPVQTTKVIGGDHDHLRENEGRGETFVYNVMNIYHKSQYFDLEYHVIATNSFLHLVKNTLNKNTISGAIHKGDWSGGGWERTGEGYQHQVGNISPLIRRFHENINCFQWQFAIKNRSKGTLKIELQYTGEEHEKGGSGRSVKNVSKTFSQIYKSDRNLLINAIAIEGWKAGDLVVSLHPSQEFDGEVFYNGLYNLGDLTQNPTEFQELYGIRINYHKIKPAESHPMIILGSKLYVGCDDLIKVFTIDPYLENKNGNIQLIETEDILLPAGMKTVALSQYGDRLTIYANSVNDAYQMIAESDGETESTSIRRGMQFMEICNDGAQDFVVASAKGSYKMYLVSGGNKKLLFSSKKIQDFSNTEPEDAYLFAFDGKASFATMERFGLSRKEGEFYLVENSIHGKALVRYTIPPKANISCLFEKGVDQIDYCYTEGNINYIQSLKLGTESSQLKEGSITLPTLSANYQDAELVNINFGVYLPNKEGKIEIWAMINETDYYTFYVDNAEGKDFTKCKISRAEGERELELIDQNLKNGSGYLSFKAKGNIKKEKDNEIGLLTLEGESLLDAKNITRYDHYIKIEEITRANQQYGNKYQGYNHDINIKKIHNQIGIFGKLSLKFKINAGRTTESPRIYAPIFLSYSQ